MIPEDFATLRPQANSSELPLAQAHFICRSKMVDQGIKVVQQNTGDTIEDRIKEMEQKPLLTHLTNLT